MSNANLEIYLNDHLAGSVAALEMMEHLEKVHAGAALSREIACIRTDILLDRAELESLLKRSGISVSPTRKTFAWLGVKAAEFKLSMDDSAEGPLHLLEALEAIALGVHGKAALWRALLVAAIPGISAMDLQRLERRALDQRERLEVLRLDAAHDALQVHLWSHA